MEKKSYVFRIAIKDPDGNRDYDYNDDFIIDVDQSIKGRKGTAAFEKALFKIFKQKIKQAVKEWFAKDPESVKYEITSYGYGYNYVPDPDDDETEADYAVENFPPRSVAHIPDDIMHNNGFRSVGDNNPYSHEFYNDLGFLND